MKLKYYLRGLGIGIIVTTIVLAISFSKREVELSDEEIIARATQLGMVMQETETETAETKETPEQQEQEAVQAQQNLIQQKNDTASKQDDFVTESEDAAKTDVIPDTEASTEKETEQDSEEAADASEEVQTDGNYRLVIKKGDVCRVVCETLAANGVITDAEAFRKYLFEIGYASNMSVGEYDIPYGLTQEEVAEILKAGPLER